VWGKWEQNVLEFRRDWYMLCFSAKWLGEKKIDTFILPDYPRYKKNREDDHDLVEALWKILDEADIIIGHNGDEFDWKKSNARFLAHGMGPPAPYRTVDTLKLARKHFRFDSNKLDDVARYLGIGRKAATTGFHMWKGCMEGDKKAWEMMRMYNERDVDLLEKVYYALRPWSTTHPNVNILTEKAQSCPICGSNKIQRRGYNISRIRKTPRYQCQSCGGWSAGKPVAPTITIR